MRAKEMKQILLPFMLILLLPFNILKAQDSCDLEVLRQSYAEQMAQVETWEDWQGITTAMQAETRNCTTAGQIF
jgi:hypothetical protein